MNSENVLVLTVKGMGHVPSFKNSKMIITKGRKGFPAKNPALITKPEYQRWMADCIRSFESQLCSSSQTIAAEMRAGHLTPYLTHWSTQFDDSVQWIPEISVKVTKVPEGQEGAMVILEEL